MLLDVKRGDIGSTSQAYADAYLDPSSPLAVDAITVSPYLGFGSLAPMIDTARKHDAGLFVLALTSNKEGAEVQQARPPTGRTVGGRMLDHLRELNARRGAARVLRRGRRRDHRRTPSVDLASTARSWRPGYGAQGGTAADIRRIFGAAARARACRARRARCCGSVPTAARCATRSRAPTTSCGA